MRALILFLASILLSIAAHAQSLRYVSGEHIEICGIPLHASACKKLVDKGSLSDLKYIVSPPTNLELTTWIEVRDTYSVCAAMNTGAYSCEQIRLPALEGMNLQTTTDRFNKPILAFSYITEMGDLPSTEKRAIARQYSEGIVEAAKRVYFRLNLKPELLDAAVDLVPWKSAVIAQSCDYNIDPFRADGLKANSEIQPLAVCIYDDLDIWYLDNFSNFGISFGVAQNPVCVAGCTATYNRDVAYCKIFPDARARAVCYGGTTAKYGACLARC